jgi:hypothetical protein
VSFVVARRILVPVAVAAALGVALTGCGGSPRGVDTAATTGAGAPVRPHASPAELRWGRQVERFVAGLVPDLRRLQQLTGGGPGIGAAGTRLDPRVLVPGAKRRQFEETMTALAACSPAFAATVPAAPTEQLRSVRSTVAHGCGSLAQVPQLVRADVLRARSPADVHRELLVEAAAQADEGVRSIVDGLSTLRRLVGGPSG